MSLTFDSEDRMTGYGSALTNGYMDSGLRAWKQNASSIRTYFLYSGSSPVCEMDSTGSVTAVNTFGQDGLISRHVGSTSTFYTFDTQGGNTQRLNSSGSVLGSSMFDSYGATVNTDGSTDPYSGFGAQSGYYTDSETGLALCTNRYYDSGNGRWLNRDPSGYDGGVDLYAYCQNDPTNNVDPLGFSDGSDGYKILDGGGGGDPEDNLGDVGLVMSFSASSDPTPEGVGSDGGQPAAPTVSNTIAADMNFPVYRPNPNAPGQPYTMSRDVPTGKPSPQAEADYDWEGYRMTRSDYYSRSGRDDHNGFPHTHVDNWIGNQRNPKGGPSKGPIYNGLPPRRPGDPGFPGNKPNDPGDFDEPDDGNGSGGPNGPSGPSGGNASSDFGGAMGSGPQK